VEGITTGDCLRERERDFDEVGDDFDDDLEDFESTMIIGSTVATNV
jgi:hypothetical protein